MLTMTAPSPPPLSPAATAPASGPSPKPSDEVAEPWLRIVRRHVHDVRNHLNGLELDATLLEELVPDPAATATIAQMRRHLTQLEAAMKVLMLKFEPPRPITIPAGDIIQLWRMQAGRLTGPDQTIHWPEDASSRTLLHLDARSLVSVLCELLLAASRRSRRQPLKISMREEAQAIILELREPALDSPLPEDLIAGAQSLAWRNGGEVTHHQDPSTREWLTTATFPPSGGS